MQHGRESKLRKRWLPLKHTTLVLLSVHRQVGHRRCKKGLDVSSYFTLHENCKEKTLIKERNGSEVQNIDQKWRISQAARWFCTATVWPRSSPLRIPTFTPSPLSPPAVSSPSDLPHPKVNLLSHLLSLFPFGLACCYESLQS